MSGIMVLFNVKYFLILQGVTFGFLSQVSTIKVYHHDKPENSQISSMASRMNGSIDALNITLSSSERQKRLQPYADFYVTLKQGRNQPREPVRYHQPGRFNSIKQNSPVYVNANQAARPPGYVHKQPTPFLKSNAIPGPFRPMLAENYQPRYQEFSRVPDNIPNHISIYEKLSQMKLSQPSKYNNQQEDYREYQNIQPGKTSVETFAAINVEIPNKQVEPYQQYHSGDYKQRPVFVATEVPIDLIRNVAPQQLKPIIIQTQTAAPTYIISREKSKQPIEIYYGKKPIIIIQNKPINEPVPIIYASTPKYVTPTNNNYGNRIKIVQQYDVSYQVTPEYEEQQTLEVPPKYENAQVYQVPPKYENYQSNGYAPQKYKTYQASTESPNSLTEILKHLQATNSLPKSLTPNDIDNSIKTLVKILTKLKKQQKFSRPIVVEDQSDDYSDYVEKDDNSDQNEDFINSVNEDFPADTPEGGTPGKPGVDYPALYSIPQTTFNCKTQRYKGFFGDPDTKCQVWHYCDLNGGQASFLCPNGTIFSQIALTCDWWYNVKCSSTAQQYVLNERLYKYILPLSPKFPEDYNGPLVDKYLALKFQEMEDKMRKEKKGKEKAAENESATEGTKVEDDSSEKTYSEETTTFSIETLETIEDSNNR